MIEKGNQHHWPKGHISVDGKHDGGQYATAAHGESAGFTQPRYSNVQFHHDAPQHVVDLVRHINAHGHEAYVVGGTVRDLMAGKEVHDYDLTTSANPDQIKEMFKGKWNADPRGEAHGTIRVPSGDGYVELTSYRKDESTDGRHAVTSHTKNLLEDLPRRDFTMNALAWDPRPESHELVGPGEGGNPMGAVADIQNKVIKFNATNGDNGEGRIKEDVHRAMRGVRFASMGASWKLDESAKTAIRNSVPLIRAARAKKQDEPGKYSDDRIREETIKAFGYKEGGKFPRDLHEVGLLEELFPAVHSIAGQQQNIHHHDDALEHTFKAVEGVKGDNKADQILNRFVMMYHDTGKAEKDYYVNGKRIAKGTAQLTDKVDDEGKAYGYSFLGHEFESERKAQHELGPKVYNLPTTIKDETGVEHPFRDEIFKRINGHMKIPQLQASDKTMRKWAREVGLENVSGHLHVRAADYGSKAGRQYPAQMMRDRVTKLMTEAPPVRPVIDGNEVMQIFGMKPGPHMRGYMDAMYDHIDTYGPAGNTRDQLVSVLQSHHKSRNP